MPARELQLKPFINFVNEEEVLAEGGKGLQDGKVGATMGGIEAKGSKSWYVYGPKGRGQPDVHAHPNEKWAHHVEAQHQLNGYLEKHEAAKKAGVPQGEGNHLTDMEH